MSTNTKSKTLFLRASWVSVGILLFSIAFIPKTFVIANANKIPIAQETSWRHTTTVTQDEWITTLGNCESGNNQNAINPKDLDNTPSLGRFQFKTGTWKLYVKKYNLFNWQEWDAADWQNTLMSGEHQEDVLTHMIYDPEVNFRHEFPDCTHRYGLPPKDTITSH